MGKGRESEDGRAGKKERTKGGVSSGRGRAKSEERGERTN